MTRPDVITPAHLGRQAVIYIRQSTPHQALSNQESLRLQYALRRRAIEWGWPAESITVIDSDLGLTGSSAAARPGFQQLVTRVTLGEVGVILSYDVTRLSRNCSDWYPLLDLCGYRDCLIGDRDGIYDPASANGRLLLGLKGQISELELHTIRARLTAGLLNKAQRGELALALPVGLIREESGRVVKHPDQEVRDRIDLVFATFPRVKSIRQVVLSLRGQGVQIPRRDRWGEVAWRDATSDAIRLMLTNPAYAGAFVYGRTRVVCRPGGRAQEPVPADEWKIRVPDKYPAYISWETYVTIQGMIRDNHSEYEGKQSRGVPRSGAALLHGIAYCGECGHKLFVQYKSIPRYVCTFLQGRQGGPPCQRLPAGPVDAHVADAFLGALKPAELDLYAQARAVWEQESHDAQRAQAQQVQRLEYEARLAERRFNHADPENRLVAAELERRWEAALRELREAERSLGQARCPAAPLSPELREALSKAGPGVAALWQGELLTPQRKKALLRCLVEKVVLRRVAPDRVHTRIVWRGEEVSEADVRVPVGALAHQSDAEEFERGVLRLAREGKADAEIAAELSREGHRSPHGETVKASTVKNIRLRHRVFIQRSRSIPRRVAGFLTVPQLAAELRVSRHWVYDRIHNGTIEVARGEGSDLYLFPDTEEARALFQRLLTGDLNKLRF